MKAVWFTAKALALLAIYLAWAPMPEETLYSLIDRSVVTVKVPYLGSEGSGFVIAPGLLVTASHVLGDHGHKVELTFDHGPVLGHRYYAGDHMKNDFALVSYPPKSGPRTFPRLSCSPLKLGQEIYVAGVPPQLGDNTKIVVKHRVAATEPKPDNATLWLTEGVYMAGMSGGPAFNRRGEVVGLNSIQIQVPSVGFADFISTGLGRITIAASWCDMARKAIRGQAINPNPHP